MYGRLKALIIKELLTILRDRSARMALIGPPLFQLLVFGFAATLEVKNVSLAVLNQDQGHWSQDLIQHFTGAPIFNSVRSISKLSEVRPIIDEKKAILVLHIPQNFSSDIEAGRATKVQLILDGRRSNAAQIVQGYVARIVQNFNREIDTLKGRPKPSSVIVARNWFNPNLNYRWFTVPNLIGTIGMVLGISVTALAIASERELGTFDQLLVSPLKPAEIIIGKTVPSLVVGLVNGTAFLLISTFFFQIPFTGSIVLLYASLTLYLLAVIGVGLFISALSQTQQQAFMGSFVFIAPGILLSGFATPVENMPDWLQTFTLINPLRHFLVIINGLFTKDMSFATVLANSWPLALIAIFTMSSAMWLFSRRME